MKAHELLHDSSYWTTGALARDCNGKSCGTAEGAPAVQWCLSGAIWWCYRDDNAKERHKAVRKVVKERYGMSLWQFNDRSGYEEVIALLKELDV
jgi:hypothetical protein